jgi:hypothetical protein
LNTDQACPSTAGRTRHQRHRTRHRTSSIAAVQ